MFRVLVLQTLYMLSDDQTEYQRDRLSFLRCVGLALHVPDAKMARASAVERLFSRFDETLRAKG